MSKQEKPKDQYVGSKNGVGPDKKVPNPGNNGEQQDGLNVPKK